MSIRSLDSLRGLAAVVVLLGHCLMVMPERIGWIKDTPLRLLFAGPSSVTVFYVLSGFVLYLTVAANPRFGYGGFLLKRIARIYPPFCVAILLSAGLYLIVRPTQISHLSDWFNHDSWALFPSPAVIAGHLAMTDLDRWHSLDNVMWSLVPELRIALIFPLIAYAVDARWRLAVGAALVVSVASTSFVQAHPVPWLVDPIRTAQYLVLFTAGAALARNRAALRLWIGRAPRAVRVAGWGGALALLSIPPTSALGLATGTGALAIVALCDGDAVADRLLNGAVPLWLGRVSYSLYLIHLPILLTVVHLLDGRLPLLALLGLTCGLSLVAAELMYRFVEAPSIRLGRALASLPGGARTPAVAAQAPVRAAAPRTLAAALRG